jgi:hypothetical protein
MILKDAHYEFNLLLNKNAERKDINIDIINYAVYYNRESKRWAAEFIERNNSSDNIFTLAELLVSNHELKRKQTNELSEDYLIPCDFFKLLSGRSYSEVVSKECKTKGIVYNWFKKPNNWNIQLEDKFTAPAFEWERGLGDISKDTITIYKTNFEIENSYISYYKLPLEINLDNVNPELELELSSYIVGQINDRIVSEIYREFNNPGFNMSETRKQITI